MARGEPPRRVLPRSAQPGIALVPDGTAYRPKERKLRLLAGCEHRREDFFCRGSRSLLELPPPPGRRQPQRVRGRGRPGSTSASLAGRTRASCGSTRGKPQTHALGGAADIQGGGRRGFSRLRRHNNNSAEWGRPRILIREHDPTNSKSSVPPPRGRPATRNSDTSPPRTASRHLTTHACQGRFSLPRVGVGNKKNKKTNRRNGGPATDHDKAEGFARIQDGRSSSFGDG